MLNQIAQKQFMDSFLNLLKSETKAGVENQKKVISYHKKIEDLGEYIIVRKFNVIDGTDLPLPHWHEEKQPPERVNRSVGRPRKGLSHDGLKRLREKLMK